MLIGLTGGIASGKSTVAKMFRKYNIPVIDADLIAREIVEPHTEAWYKIIEHFGEEVLTADQTIDRKKLAELIFQDDERRQVLNEITHPLIISRIILRAEQLSVNFPQVIVDIPLLFESKREALFDQIIVVYVSPEEQLSRLMKRDSVDKELALLRINSQMRLMEKVQKADIVIYNDNVLEETEKQVIACIKLWEA